MIRRFIAPILIAFSLLFSSVTFASAAEFPYPDYGKGTKSDSDTLQVYAPAGFKFTFSFRRLNGDIVQYDFEGKGRSEPSFEISYSELYNGGIMHDSGLIFGSYDGMYYPAISSEFGTLTPSMSNDWLMYPPNSSGDVALSFITTCLKFDSKIYLNLTDMYGQLIEGIEVTPNPIESLRPNNDAADSDVSLDMSFLVDSVNGFSSLISVTWDIFPFLGVMIAVLLVVLYVKVVL